MLQYDFEASVGYWMAMGHHAFMRSLQQALAPHGITFRQAQVLGCLAAEGPMTQREIADMLLVEPPNLVGVIDRMEEAGLVQRRPCEDDARKKLIHPLPAAMKQWRQIADCGRAVREQAVAGLSRRDQDELHRLLTAVRENLEAPALAR
ncbi:MarR family winged helix-turn-helix transcriptional regulator [Botrimarina mediterranea]|uniref:Transcriptional regulator SlyA n=1 Tax=Botrimarina mediterranea TaxID=2528022 RepID=A0A518K8E4_9BACT|nr:MarR family transcriptional regulator [Botrimarina mediterranea]QDV74059.1 transcriptional regulator SlyA [Botrimarina mediterranea]